VGSRSTNPFNYSKGGDRDWDAWCSEGMFFEYDYDSSKSRLKVL
jgi:hypothetical protein